MYLVTGATGLVGSHLIQRLIGSGKKVRAIKRASSDLSVFGKYLGDPTLPGKVEWVEGDVLDIYSLIDAMEGVDKVFHTAAVVSFHSSDRKQLLKINSEGTANVVNAALEKNIGKLCHVSSVAAIGRTTKPGIITEENKWSPSSSNSVYAISKYNAEREVWRGIAEGLNAVIVNPSIILGPARWDAGSSKIFSTVHKGLKFYTNGSNAFVDVRDVAKIMDLLMESDIVNERFIVMAENLSYREVFSSIATCFGKKPPAYRVSPALTGLAWRLEALKSLFTGLKPVVTRETARTASQHNQYSNGKIRKALGGYEFIPIHQSVKDTCRMFLGNAD